MSAQHHAQTKTTTSHPSAEAMPSSVIDPLQSIEERGLPSTFAAPIDQIHSLDTQFSISFKFIYLQPKTVTHIPLYNSWKKKIIDDPNS